MQGIYMKYIWALPLLLVGLQIPTFADTILPGTEIRVRIDNPIQVSKWDEGQIFAGYVQRNVYAQDGNLAVPAGSNAELIVRRIGPNQLALDLESITANGQRYVMNTQGPSFNMPQAEYQNGSGLVGNVLGIISNSAGFQVEAQGDHIYVPAGSVIRFSLQEPLHTVSWGDPGYMDNGYHHHHDQDWYR
jgi:hypothetical protein